jgi:hypothetical protein
MPVTAEQPSRRFLPPVSIRFLTPRVAVVQWSGYWFTISQIRWGVLRRFLYRRVYRLTCPPAEVRYETAVFLSQADGRFNPQKPLQMSYQTTREEARAIMRQLAEQVAGGHTAFQGFFRR